ncbi:hypothetical protein [Kaistella rhinocerotis]|uniref:hypothetical protein n=1 Tax=Kaistella rhinocerotis TaxID=3026437 RepID=UPI002554B254|nr:hypothetical protein [Kaistella sp. Ran72]
MIDKNFYLENLTAFDTLIETDKIEAEKAIFKVYCILQRDKYWLNHVATPEEIGEEDAELLDEVETELNDLEEAYGYRFAYFHQLVMEEMQKTANGNPAETDLNAAETTEFDSGLTDDELDVMGDEDEFLSTDDFDEDDFEEDDDYEGENSNQMGDFSDEELNLVVDYVLNSAKQKFDYEEFLMTYAEATPEFLDDHVLLYVIARKAYGEPEEDIAESLEETFAANGLDATRDELVDLIDTFGKKLSKEILAFGIAMDSLQHGTHPVDVVAHISDII